jgi:hypothetical protein
MVDSSQEVEAVAIRLPIAVYPMTELHVLNVRLLQETLVVPSCIHQVNAVFNI